jgi:hypothetical protein
MPRFVVLRHEPDAGGGKPLHWDFMLECNDILRTWALADEPQANCLIDAERIADHRPAYLDFEGAVSGNRGKVIRWDAGTYDFERDENDLIEIRLHGRHLTGSVTLRHLAPDTQRWIFAFAPSNSMTDR